MEISKQLIYKNLHFLAIEQLADEYKAKGYIVEKEKQLGKYRADLVVSKDGEKIVFEVKTGRMSPERKEQIAKFTDYVNSLGDYKFKIIIARSPKEKNIQIVEFEELFFDYLINDFPSELDELSTHTILETISDIVIHDLIVHNGNEINVIGEGIVEVRLQYGSDGDARRGDGFYQYESFPFDFDLYLSYDSQKKLIINESASIEINTDSFYK